MSDLLIRSLLAFTLGLCLVLAVRRIVRRGFGATSAYALWTLPFAMLLAAGLPAWHTQPTGKIPVAHTVVVLLHRASVSMQASRWITSALLLLWLGGAVVTVLRLVTRHRRLHREMRPAPADLARELGRSGSMAHQPPVRCHDAGPAVIWSGRTLLVLPADFLTRFDARQRQLILEHERTHLRHGDTWWNLLTELLTVALWFHPLVWFARPRFRLDQELACDDSLLLRHPHCTSVYAHTLFHGTGHAGTPVLATWLDEPQLKERLTMIRNRATRKPWRRMGVPVLALLMAGSALSAQAMQQTVSHATTPPSAALKSRARHPPRYPAQAIKNRKEGTVIVRVKVGKDGSALEANAIPTPTDRSLVNAAVAAAKEWKYHPATGADGKPVIAWVKVPVKFSLGKYAPGKKN